MDSTIDNLKERNERLMWRIELLEEEIAQKDRVIRHLTRTIDKLNNPERTGLQSLADNSNLL